MKSYQAVYQILTKETDYISGEKIAEELSLSRTSIWKAIRRLFQEAAAPMYEKYCSEYVDIIDDIMDAGRQ